MLSLFTDHLLTWLMAIPILGMAAVGFLRDQNHIRWVALGTTVLEFLFALVLWSRFDHGTSAMQFVERVMWMPTFRIQYAVGVDGISFPLVLLTTLLPPFCVLSAWRNIETRLKAFMMLILMVEGGMVAVFSALDLFLFFMLWEVTMIPMYFMILLWGGPERIAAAIKFVLYSLAGSLLLLVGILGLYLNGGETFDLLALSRHTYAPDVQFWIFLALLLAFAIKLPMVPFHTWLPDAHSEAPTAGSVILAGILLKMGGYGFLRLCLPIFPEMAVTFTPLILWMSIIGILYGGYMALAQSDLKRLIAYSSISHMGFVTLGIFVFNNQGIQGAVLQMFNHGITTGALFLAVGQLYDRTHSRQIEDYGGLHRTMPRFVTVFCIFIVASFALPGTNNFISEFLVLVGTSFRSFLMVLLAMGGIVLAAGYMLWMLQRVAWGPVQENKTTLFQDLRGRELATVVPLATLVLLIGLYPGPLLQMMDSTVTGLVEHLDGRQAMVLSKDSP